MANFWRIVHDVIRKSDIIVIVADARLPEISVHKEILDKIEKEQKKYLIVFNKIDLLNAEGKKRLKETLTAYDFTMSVSAKSHDKTMALLRKLNALARGEVATVGVVGYPNTGKSSIINALKGRNSAPVSSRAGHTKGLQRVRVSAKISLLDTPGVIPYDERYNVNHQTILSSKNAESLRDPEGAVFQILEEFPHVLELFYEVPVSKDVDATLENIANTLNIKKKGNIPDTKRAAVRVIQDWQSGKIKQ
ncbi:MAG: GTPase [Candidatus Woesearchaeota archaeon]